MVRKSCGAGLPPGTIGPSFFLHAEDGIRDTSVAGVQTCALPIFFNPARGAAAGEERSPQEVTHIPGRSSSGRIETVRLVPEGSTALNLAFDVTPARLVTGSTEERRGGERGRHGGRASEGRSRGGL